MFNPVARSGRYWDNFLERKQGRPGRDFLKDLIFFGNKIYLVQHQHYRRGHFFQDVGNKSFIGLSGCIDHQQQQINAADGRPGNINHAPVEPRAPFMNPGCVDEHDLAFGNIMNALYPVTGSLGLVGCNDNLLPDDVVQQSRFAHIGTTDDGNES